ncbi:MAG: 3-dehydroquinate dehydratase-1 [Rhodothermales bacterium]|jgi:3-dehydroquinate dehydratase-1
MHSLDFKNSPFVVGTLSSQDTFSILDDSLPCDALEVRFDLIGLPMPELLAADALWQLPRPLIFTPRWQGEGGKLPNEGRLPLYEAVIDRVAAVDVEYRCELRKEVAPLARQHGVTPIISYHDFSATPPLAELVAVVEEATVLAGVAKIAATVETPEDLAVLEELLAGDWDVPLCVIGMGSLGAATRFDFPLRGSCLTYGFIDSSAAPGQPHCRELSTHLGR